MPYLDKAVPLKEHICGNCRYWEKCKDQIAPFKYNGAKREQVDPACMQFYPVTINGQEILFKDNIKHDR